METIWNIGITWTIFFQNLGSWLKTPMEAFSFFGTEIYSTAPARTLPVHGGQHRPAGWYYPSFEHFGQ
jgi:hypothetical protein